MYLEINGIEYELVEDALNLKIKEIEKSLVVLEEFLLSNKSVTVELDVKEKKRRISLLEGLISELNN